MKKLSLRFPCLLLAGMVAFASAQAQQTVTGKIAAQSNSEPIAGAIVTLVEHDSIPTMQTQTNADGRFSLTSKEQGNLFAANHHDGLRTGGIGHRQQREENRPWQHFPFRIGSAAGRCDGLWKQNHPEGGQIHRTSQRRAAGFVRAKHRPFSHNYNYLNYLSIR